MMGNSSFMIVQRERRHDQSVSVHDCYPSGHEMAPVRDP